MSWRGRAESHSKRWTGGAAGAALIAMGAVCGLPAAAAVATADQEAVTLTGRLTLVADAPGASARLATDTAVIGLAEFDDEIQSLGLVTGDEISVEASPPAPGAPDASVRRVIPGSANLLARAPQLDANPAPAVAASPHEIALVRVSWPGAQLADAPTFDQLVKAYSDSNAFWSVQSRGGITFAVVKQVDNIQLSASPCTGTVDEEAEVIKQIQWGGQPRQHVVIAGPKCLEGIGKLAAGWGSLGSATDSGGFVFLNGGGAVAPGPTGNAARVLAHELGHNLGLLHANEVGCGPIGLQTVNGAPGDCRNIEYAGAYSVMGSTRNVAPPALNGQHAFIAGLTDDKTLLDVTAQTSATQSFELAPVGDGKGLQFARFTDGASNAYVVEYRAPVGLDAEMLDPSAGHPLPSGVVISKAFAEPDGTLFRSGEDLYGTKAAVDSRDTYQLDANPAHNPYLSWMGGTDMTLDAEGPDGDAVMPVGSELLIGDVRVKVASVTPTGAKVDVTFSAGRKTSKPGAPVNVKAASFGTEAAKVSWSRPQTDGGAYVTGYRVTAKPDGQTCTTVIDLACVVEGLKPGSVNTFTVEATNVVGTSDASVQSSGVTMPAPTPSQTVTPTPTPTGSVVAAPSVTSTPTQTSQAVVVAPAASATPTHAAVAYAPTSSTSGTSNTSSLAQTGFNATWMALGGFLLIAGGIALVWRFRPTA